MTLRAAKFQSKAVLSKGSAAFALLGLLISSPALAGGASAGQVPILPFGTQKIYGKRTIEFTILPAGLSCSLLEIPAEEHCERGLLKRTLGQFTRRITASSSNAAVRSWLKPLEPSARTAALTSESIAVLAPSEIRELQEPIVAIYAHDGKIRYEVRIKDLLEKAGAKERELARTPDGLVRWGSALEAGNGVLHLFVEAAGAEEPKTGVSRSRNTPRMLRLEIDSGKLTLVGAEIVEGEN